MLAILIIVIFVSYIGLGIPDSLLGAAWPAIYPEFSLPISAVSIITAFISVGTIFSSFMSARIIKKLGTARVTALSTVITALALFGFSAAPNIYVMCALAFPLGLGAGSVDTALNNYIALNFSRVYMNFLHCFYGIGVSASPYIMSVFLRDDSNWRGGYRSVAILQACIAVIVIVSMPVWKKVQSKAGNDDIENKLISVKDVLKNSAARTSLGVFVGSCAIESVCLAWGSTFFADAKGAAADVAAKMITFYYIGMTIGRFVSGVLSTKLKPFTLILSGQVITAAAVVLLTLPFGLNLAVFSLALVGFGNGAIFPNMTALTPASFGKEASQSVIGIQMGFAYVSILVTPAAFGVLAQNISTALFPYFLAFVFIVMEYSTIRMKTELKKGIKL